MVHEADIIPEIHLEQSTKIPKVYQNIISFELSQTDKCILESIPFYNS